MIDRDSTATLDAVLKLLQPTAELHERTRGTTSLKTWLVGADAVAQLESVRRAYDQLDSLIANHGWVEPAVPEEGEDVTDETVTPTRWDHVDDEDLAELCYGVLERFNTPALPDEVRARAGDLAEELYREIKRRRDAAPSYRGPGRYLNNIDGEEVRVLGLARVGGLASHYVVCEESDDGDGIEFFMERIDVFNGATMDDRSAYEYVGPLWEES